MSVRSIANPNKYPSPTIITKNKPNRKLQEFFDYEKVDFFGLGFDCLAGKWL